MELYRDHSLKNINKKSSATRKFKNIRNFTQLSFMDVNNGTISFSCWKTVLGLKTAPKKFDWLFILP